MQRKIYKNIFRVAVITAVMASSLPFFKAQGDVNAALSYLSTKNSNPWVTMALYAAGQTPNVDYLTNATGTKAIDLEAPILAITAAGRDPRTFAKSDLVTALRSFYANGQIGDATTLNDDIFGILALVSAGVPATDTIISGTKTFILQHQNSDGGWSFSVGGGSDTNTTAAAIMALLETGVTSQDAAITNAVAYLKNAQNSDGGFPYDPKSSWGTASDASSGSWIISALNKSGINPQSWTKGDNNPVSHLLSLQAESGYFQFQAGSGEDSFTPITTSYAAIALLGKSYPVNKISPAAPLPLVDFRIEGSAAEICSGSLEAQNAMDVVKVAAAKCNFTYHIQDTSFGQYLDQIGGDAAQGMTGWLYLVDFISPSVGAADYALKNGDEVIWYYGNYGSKPTRLALSSSQVVSGASVGATVEAFDSGTWSGLGSATVHAGSLTFTTDSSGGVNLTLSDGVYNVFAEKEGYIRSEREQVVVGQVTQASLNLTANISGGGETGEGQQNQTSVSFSVEAEGGGNLLDFGTITPGTAKTKNFLLKNPGQSKISVKSGVSGNEVFRNYITIDNGHWHSYEVILQNGGNKTSGVLLSVPKSYGNSGIKNGTLIFWAMGVQ